MNGFQILRSILIYISLERRYFELRRQDLIEYRVKRRVTIFVFLNVILWRFDTICKILKNVKNTHGGISFSRAAG